LGLVQLELHVQDLLDRQRQYAKFNAAMTQEMEKRENNLPLHPSLPPSEEEENLIETLPGRGGTLSRGRGMGVRVSYDA
jgi:hypothetical protein